MAQAGRKGQVGDLLVSLRTDLGQLRTDVREIERTFNTGFNNIQLKAQQVGRALGRAFGITLGITGLAAAGTGLINLARNAAKFADEIGKAAQRAGTTTEFLSAMRHGANLADVSFEELTNGITRFNRVVNDAANGLTTAKRPFDTLGIAFKDTNGLLKTNEVLLTEIAEAFQKLPDGVQKSAVAQELFGRSGARLIPLLNGGADGIKKFTDEAKRLGVIVSSEAAKAAEQFNDNMQRLTTAAKGLGFVIGNNLIPVLIAALDLFAKLGGVQLEGALERQIERQIRALTRLRDLARSGSGFDFYQQEIEKAQKSLDELRASQEKTQTKTALPPPIDPSVKKGIDEVKKATESFIQGLEKQEDSLRASIIELERGARAAKEYGLDIEFANLKTKLLAEGKALPAGFEAEFLKARDRVLDLTDALEEAKRAAETHKNLLEQIFGAADAVDSEFGQALRDRRDEELAVNRAIAERIKLLEIEQAFAGFDLIDAEQGEQLREAQDRIRSIGETMVELRERMAQIAGEFQVFGAGFNKTSAEIGATRDAIRDLLAQGVDPLDARIQQLGQTLSNLEGVQAFEQSMQSVFDALKRGLDDTLTAAISGTQEFSEAMQNIFRNMMLRIAQIMVENAIINPLMNALQGAGGTGGGAAGGILRLLFGKEGGPVPYGLEWKKIPRFDTGGAVLAMLHNNEFVQPERATQHYGMQFMEDVKNLKIPKFQFGGLVRGPSIPSYQIGGSVSASGIHGAASGLRVEVLGSIIPERQFARPEDVVRVSRESENRAVLRSKSEVMDGRRRGGRFSKVFE